MSVIRQRILENMQKFSRAMIGAVLFLPVIGLILALSSVLTNPTLISETSFLHQLGQLLGDTFWPLFGNLGLLFCVGISYGLAKDKKTEVALVSVMCFIMFLGANHSWLEHTHGLAEKINGEYYGTGQTQLLGFVVVDMGVFLGIILGCTIAWVHNKVSTIELPGALSMYGGAKLTLVAMTPVVIFYAIAFTWIWPFMTHGIAALTGFMKNAGVAGVFVYGFFEKFLIPTGLHHFVWSPFQLTQIGGTLNVDGQVVSGTQAIFLAYMRHPDLTPVMNEALRFSQQGMTTIFGLAGACGWLALLALYAGGPRPDGRLTGMRWLASAVGRRSMTVYLSQTNLFGSIFGVVPLLVTGRRLWMGQAAAALVALGVWLVSVVLCAALERGGHAGPFETLLRTAVARSERRRPTPPPPPAVWPGMQAGPQPAP